MSGRIHIFMLPEYETKLAELLTILGLTDEQYGASHAIQSALEITLDLEKRDALTEEQKALICDVPDPVNHGHTTVFFRQANVNLLFNMMQKYEIDHHDYTIGHICTLSFLWLLDSLEKGAIEEDHLKRMKKVKPPKKVMYT